MLITLRGQAILCARTINYYCFKYAHTEGLIHYTEANKDVSSVTDKGPYPNDYIDITFEKKSPLDTCTEDTSYVAPYLKPTFNFAAYINQSETLQQLLKLGVNLHKLEKKRNVPPFILRLDFEKDIKNHILLFLDRGLEVRNIADIFTRNPFILKEDIEDLKVRINYLMYKKFDNAMISRILCQNPFWLMFSANRIDERLGYFQRTYKLTGNEVRTITCKQPRLITYSLEHVKLNNFALKEEMGFSDEDVKSILIRKPKTFMKDKEKMCKTFDYIVNTMNIPQQMITEWPEVLTCREFRIKQRHLFLEALGKVQYDPKLPNYISLLSLVSGKDSEFAVDIAKSSLQAFNAFLKTL
ncbi:hypothetical protein AMK59_7401 [Oryctes borbonicus]|uniref:Transcription termination factor 3, mitochondrial n=1 Tax=Oryctes borbonicus TaxID=1629725 RepID=A0A0T6ASZ7_9SCAR|nr:hypothetical protein AMK59_7401 [Oryctes borbonicus]